MLCYKSEGSGFNSRWGHLIFSVYAIHPAALWPWALLNLQQKQVPEGLSGSKTRPASKADILAADFLENVESSTCQQPYRPPWSLTGMAFLYFLERACVSIGPIKRYYFGHCPLYAAHLIYTAVSLPDFLPLVVIILTDFYPTSFVLHAITEDRRRINFRNVCI
jgi:hypothetical protein